jgi:F420-dependent oxidoreductase-like protein
VRVAIGIGPAGDNWQEMSDYVREAEKLGVHAAWSAETWGFDAATPIAYLASQTSTIRLGTGIMQVAARTPANIAMTAMSLSSMTGGRFALGLGASGPQVVEGWHGVSFKRIIRRLRETVEIVRLISSGERVRYEGAYFELPLPGGEGKALRTSAQPMEIPIYLATLGSKSLEMTGELADGWLGTSFMPDHSDIFFEHIARGAERAGRSLSEIDLQVNAGVVAFADDVEALIPPRKPGLAFTLGAMGSREHNFYNDAYRRAGYEDVARDVQSLWLDGKRDEAAARVPDELVLKSNLIGSEQTISERVGKHRDAGVTTLSVQPAGRTLAERVETLGRFVELVREIAAEAPARSA